MEIRLKSSHMQRYTTYVIWIPVRFIYGMYFIHIILGSVRFAYPALSIFSLLVCHIDDFGVTDKLDHLDCVSFIQSGRNHSNRTFYTEIQIDLHALLIPLQSRQVYEGGFVDGPLNTCARCMYA